MGGGGGAANWCMAWGGCSQGCDSWPLDGCQPYGPSPQKKRNRREGDIFHEGEVFFMEEREEIPMPLCPSHGNRSPGQPQLGWGGEEGLQILEPILFPSREPGAQTEGTAHPECVRDSATGSGRAALCQCPKLQGLVAAGGGGRALFQPLGTWLSQMPQPGSVSGTCVRAFYISIKS